MIKAFSKMKTLMIGCSIPFIFFILFKISKILGLNWNPAFEVAWFGFLIISFPWSVPSFALVTELIGLIGSTFRGYLQVASLILGFGINFVLLLKFGTRYWLISVLKFFIFVVIFGIFFTIWMISREYM